MAIFVEDALRTFARFNKTVKAFIHEHIRRKRLSSYIKSDRRPWRTGYNEFRNLYLSNVIDDDAVLKTFRKGMPLPDRYGFRLDARVVEIPWIIALLAQRTGRLLDAGSSLNHEYVLKAPALADKCITIVTLAPEGRCYWRSGISYVFGDLRNLDFRDGLFDAIACISTIEHVGMDNTRYDGSTQTAKLGGTEALMSACKELNRVLAPDGVLYITFPFGRYENHGWFQQFDSRLMDKLIECFNPGHFNKTLFRYDPDGWKLSDRKSCEQCRFFDVQTSKYFDPNSTIEYPSDFPAGERAVACLELFK